jgi:hypothetical protein
MLNSFSFLGSLQVSRALQHTFRFAGLKAIVFILIRSWKESICSLAYLLRAVPLIEYFGLHVSGELAVSILCIRTIQSQMAIVCLFMFKLACLFT